MVAFRLVVGKVACVVVGKVVSADLGVLTVVARVVVLKLVVDKVVWAGVYLIGLVRVEVGVLVLEEVGVTLNFDVRSRKICKLFSSKAIMVCKRLAILAICISYNS